jgi:flagellar biosynthesis protein FlhG
VSLVDEAGVQAEQARIQEAHDTLLDPVRKRAYDLSTFPEDDHGGQSTGRSRRALSEDELAYAQAELAREITAETQFTGHLLRRAREALDLEIEDMAQQTKISPFHLRAIEAEDFAAMPAQVYVSGFLKLIAQVLGLDPMQVAKTYLQRKRAADRSSSR